MTRCLPIFAVCSAFALTGCTIPDDTDGTYEHIKGGTLRVGVTEHEPWVSLERPDPSGVEVGLIRELAARLDAEVDYTSGSEEELVEALRERDLDVVIGGITDQTGWKKHVAMTKPYLTTHLVVGAPRSTVIGDGTRIAYERGTVAGSLIDKKTDGVPMAVDSLKEFDGPVATEDYLLDDLGLEQAESLKAEEHVMLTGPGENRWLVTLERFLLDRKQRALDLLAEEARPE